MRRENISTIMVLLLFVSATLFGGCGSGKKEGEEDSVAQATRIDNANCTNTCHAASQDPVTGTGIVADWNNSPHKNSDFLVDCQSCHGGGSLHWGMGPIPYPNPDSAGICRTCHTDSRLGQPHIPKLTPAILASTVIWDNMSTAGYVTARNSNKCTTCHRPHDNTVLQQNREWAESGHGDTTAQPWMHYDFKARADCNRCHTTTGYVKYVTTGDKAAWATANSSDKTKEVLRCDGCHTDYSWNRRALGAVRADYTNVPSFFYPDSRTSNICLNCHIGRESGDSIKNLPATTNFTNTGFINSHYLTAGGTLFGQTGYEYAERNYVNDAGFLHDQIGITGVNGTGTTRGPCVGCHLTSPASHRFLPVEEDANGVITAVTSTLCANCHGGLSAAGLEAEKEALAAALEALKAQLAVQGYNYTTNYPYFANRNWEKFGAGTGKDTMGAAFNYNLLSHDPGAFAHNSNYTKRLIYDSIDWMNDGILDGDVESAINALTAITAAQKTSAITYLLGGPGGTRP
jgi:hypothetical protein